jgi:hypothetical protein
MFQQGVRRLVDEEGTSIGIGEQHSNAELIQRGFAEYLAISGLGQQALQLHRPRQVRQDHADKLDIPGGKFPTACPPGAGPGKSCWSPDGPERYR